ncbi:MAG: C40 family peptidase [Bacteroidales bacterium]|nr:C40 family peptidase [Candidatus Cacconaster merdequi]
MKRLLFYVSCLVLVIGCNGGREAQQTASEPQYEELDGLALASLSVINMREDPDYAAELGTQALMGTPVKVHYAPEDDYWVNIETPDGYKAWVNEMAVQMIDEQQLSSWKRSERVIVTADYTFFLEEPKSDAQRVSDAVCGCIAQFVSKNGRYTEVMLPTGKHAFVPSDDVMDFKEWAESREALVPADAPQSDVDKARAAIIATARKFIGVPYLWAGTSIKGVDCSGFSKTVYYLNGYVLLRNASQQYKTGDPVDVSEGYDNLQPADLVFFGREATAEKPEKITHVGIYLGDGMIIHSSQVVRINNVADENAPDYYSRKIIRAARIIGTQDCGKGVSSVAGCGVYFE